jgi:hypothetical protein
VKHTLAVRSFFLLTSACLLLSLPAMAGSELYTNGPINGNSNAWYVVGGVQTISDSFGLPSTSTIGSISFGDWVLEAFGGNAALTVTWSITSAPNGGTVFGSGTSSLTNTLFCSSSLTCGLGNFNVYTSSFPTNVALNAGSYYLNLLNISTSNGSEAGWDINSGVGCAGTGCPSSAYANGMSQGSQGSDSFTLYSPIPEPSTVLDMFGTGAFCLAGVFVRRLRAKLPIRSV